MTDQNNNDITPASSTGPFSVAGAFTLLCYPSGTGTDTYPADIQQNLPGVDFLNPYGAPYYFDNTASSNASPFSGYYSDTENNDNGVPFYNNGSAWETINGTKTSTTTSSLICQFHYQGTGTPPAYLNILETSSAGVSASVSCASNAPPSSELSASASASDGLGDSASQSADASTFSNFYSPTPSQTTKQLVEVPVLKGIATVSIPTDVSITEVDTAPYWGAGNTGYGATDTQVTAMVSAEANIDSRAVSISSSLGKTYHRPSSPPAGGWLSAQPVLNTPVDGVLTDDTVAPYTGGSLLTIPQETINYTATYGGSWSADSSYQWNFALNGYNTSGTFMPYAIGNVSNTYTSMLATPGSEEHAFLDLVDSGDQAKATGDYYVKFHAPLENWTPTGTVILPDISPQGPNQPGDYQVDNSFFGPGSGNYSSTSDTTTSITASLNGQATQSIPPDQAASFQENAGISFSKTWNVGSTTAYTPKCPAGEECTVYWALSQTQHLGTCSTYQGDGYAGDAEWQYTTPNLGPDGIAQISWADTFSPIP